MTLLEMKIYDYLTVDLHIVHVFKPIGLSKQCKTKSLISVYTVFYTFTTYYTSN